ncbi:MAG: DUF2202 domain-containing protein [Chlorobi bacterium]|nr:DUF2202 domain-containing protein [Chlorobiota bacterium]
MKTLKFNTVGILIIILSLFAFSSCEETVMEDVENVALSAESDSDSLSSSESDSLESDVYSSLVYMREEEKLAHDVYVTLFDLWDAQVFENISNSETRHTESIKGLLDYYGIEDPAQDEVGKFTNEDLQELYNTLVTSGQASLIEALKVGATIEEVDIIDLDEAMEGCEEDTILTVYSHLRTGSTHHLKAFVSNLAAQGVEYAPQYLSQEEYDEIINSTTDNEDYGHGDCQDSTAVLDSLTEEDAAGLIWMREEEKLAHDVYVNLYSAWGIRVFDNISKSETKHTESVLNLLNLYGLEDPASPEIGVFNNEDLQALYDQLMEQGQESEIAALIVGATIEEVDILDLYERMSDNETIQNVYTSLELGSEAHLRAFVYQLKLRGYEYAPQYLTEDQYEDIIDND